MSLPYRTRYAPTPSGPMHLGHARTHLVAFLRARSRGGRLLMRVDDLDTPRVREGSLDDFLRAHEWLGLEFDEGPIHQRDRLALYDEALAGLARAGAVYACACSRKEIEALEPGPAGDGGLRYPGTCRARRLEDGPGLALRLRLSEPSPGFEDAALGAVAPGQVHGDFVLRRADGFHAYHLASVVDDLALGVSEVVRGEDLLLATSRQLALYAALEASPPGHLHVPLLLGPDGKRLAKSHGSAGVLELREAGVTAEALLGELAFSLGLLPAPAAASAAELVERFELASIALARPTL